MIGACSGEVTFSNGVEKIASRKGGCNEGNQAQDKRVSRARFPADRKKEDGGDEKEV